MSFRQRPIAAEALPRHPLLRVLLHTVPGQAVVAGAAAKLVAGIGQLFRPDSAWLDVLDTIGTLALLGGLIWFLVRLLSGARRRLLWRVRRKLILSYIFVGFVPALLIIVFCLLCGLLLFGTISQYIVDSRMASTMEESTFFARTASIEIAQLDDEAQVRAYLARKQATLASRQPGASLVLVPVTRACPEAEALVPADGRFRSVRPIAVGPWPHLEPPSALPEWVPCEGFSGLVAYRIADRGHTDNYLALRSVVLAEGRSPRFAVILDVPLTDETVRRLQEETGIELRAVTTSGVEPQAARAGALPLRSLDPAAAEGGPFQLAWVTFFDFTDWGTGEVGSATISIGMRIGEIYDRLSPATLGGGTFGRALVMVIAVVGLLFLLIQFIALVMGLALARSITGSVHELFVGTLRVQQGDFAHRIRIPTRDQLGELADSFNVMTSRLTDLLAQMAEKKRLEEELRIARQIQMSLLPQGPARMPGLTMTAHCSPAREVGGDYYDFLPIDEHRIGILIADVSGKGTSAALYMAELKGLVLSLSQIHRSPRDLMIAANRIIADNLDNRSFITMTYVVADLQQRTMTYARAGHTPLIHLPARADVRRARILAPDGMVLGLKLDGGERFSQLLEEVTLPLEPGDLFVLFNDGISEAMNDGEELFGESRLGALIEEHADLPFDELRERILREVRAFTGEPGPHDDMTLILIKVEPRGSEGLAIDAAARAVQPATPAH